MLLYVIAYDIPDHKRRKSISDILEGYGSRVQYSVFECVLSRSKYEQLLTRLRSQFKAGEDSLRFYPISGHTANQVEIWGEPPLTPPPSSIVI